MQQTPIGNQVVVLREDKAPAHGIYNLKTKALSEITPPSNANALEDMALVNSLLPAFCIASNVSICRN